MAEKRRNTTETSSEHTPPLVVNMAIVNNWRTRRGLSETEFARSHHFGQVTYRKMKHEETVQLSTLRKLAGVLGETDITRLLLNPPPTDDLPMSRGGLIVDEWEPIDPIGGWNTLSNGLQCRTYRMRHRHTPNRFARGKCYELDGMYDRERDQVKEYFLRHSDICHRVGSHPNLPVNLRCCPDSTCRWWWVVDQWTTGKPLSEVIQNRALLLPNLKSVMGQIANGLERLHSVGVIRRELSPKSILYDTKSERVVLTDFELGKLSDGRPTVAKGEWPVDPYRAPEVGKGRLNQSADVFSWGRIFVHAATGSLPTSGTEELALKKTLISSAVRELVVSCVDDLPRQRPPDIATVMKTLNRW